MARIRQVCDSDYCDGVRNTSSHDMIATQHRAHTHYVIITRSLSCMYLYTLLSQNVSVEQLVFKMSICNYTHKSCPYNSHAYIQCIPQNLIHKYGSYIHVYTCIELAKSHQIYMRAHTG